MDRKWARVWFGTTALCVVVGVVIQLFVTAHARGGHFQSATNRVLNVFVFFTIQSNLIVGITVTGIVYHVALAQLLDLDSWALAADQLLHTVVPILAVVGWFAFGPRRLTSAHVARRTVLFPIAWLAFTIIRGAIIHWYPYPFVDVDKLGYLKTVLNAAWVAVLVLGVAAGATALDTWLGGAPDPMPSRG